MEWETGNNSHWICTGGKSVRWLQLCWPHAGCPLPSLQSRVISTSRLSQSQPGLSCGVQSTSGKFQQIPGDSIMCLAMVTCDKSKEVLRRIESSEQSHYYVSTNVMLTKLLGLHFQLVHHIPVQLSVIRLLVSTPRPGQAALSRSWTDLRLRLSLVWDVASGSSGYYYLPERHWVTCLMYNAWIMQKT